MKKQVQGVVKQVIRQSLIGYTQSIILTVLLVVFSVVVVRNISASQDVPPLYYLVFDDNPKTMVMFLRKIKDTPEYARFETMAVNTYGESIENEIHRDQLKRKYDIARLESILVRNPRSRDVLAALAILYRRDSNMGKYEEYKTRALAVDPKVTID